MRSPTTSELALLWWLLNIICNGKFVSGRSSAVIENGYACSYLVALSLQQEQQGDPQPVAPGTAQAWPQPTDQGLEPTLSE